MIKYTWDEVYNDARELAEHIMKDYDGDTKILIYGIPRGGWLAAMAVSTHYPQVLHLTANPQEADWIIDDIMDSGTTIERYNDEYSGKKLAVIVRHLKHSEGSNAEVASIRPVDDWVEFPWEAENLVQNAAETIEDNVRRILQAIGEDPKRDGLVDTPARVARMYKEVFAGYGDDYKKYLARTFPSDGADGIVMVNNITFFSYCEHHMVPFYGTCHIAYIPKDKIVGISKLARVVRVFARRLQVQEKLTENIANAINDELDCAGVAVWMKAKHMCMSMRGIENTTAETVTIQTKGMFRTQAEMEVKFLNMVNTVEST